MPKMFPLPIAADGALTDDASNSKPSGRRSTRSPWLIQTGNSPCKPSNNGEVFQAMYICRPILAARARLHATSQGLS